MRFLVLGLCLVSGACAEPLPTAPADPLETSDTTANSADLVFKAIGAGLQGDARYAIELLKSAEPASLNQRDRRYRSCMLKRFGDSVPPKLAPATDSPVADQIVAAYVSYWREALRAPELRQEYTRALEGDLRDRLDLTEDADNIQIENEVRARLNAEGLGVLLGQTGVLRELMIWRQEDRQSMTVELPHGAYKTEVALLDDFVISGWGQFATCETRGAGGWVADRTLFAVVPVYDDLEGEEFRVTFLGHETQHFLDLDVYPNMASWELEYRAKLMELAMADRTRLKVLQKFIEDQGDDPLSPHSFANRKILTALLSELSLSDSDALRSVEGQAIRDAASRLFEADTAMRDRQRRVQ
ncbi:MAG: hypothetical protein AAFQ62_01505 [Pseudomonadota bacterium]